MEAGSIHNRIGDGYCDQMFNCGAGLDAYGQPICFAFDCGDCSGSGIPADLQSMRPVFPQIKR